MYAAPENFESIFETSFNPPGAYSITFPLYFNNHSSMMRSYKRTTNFTALIGSDPTGTVSKKRDIIFGRAIDWNQSENDLFRVRRALYRIVSFSKEAGAKKIILPTNPALIIQLDNKIEEKLEKFDDVLNDKKYFNFVTAHPQGGNMMAADSFNERVVDLDFRVKDTENLFVCDASIFPRGIRVNPQWTIMALASAASQKISELS
jgi:choline dehydrogenase-like flavoprotein